MIRIQHGNTTFGCDTPEEAIKLHKLLSAEYSAGNKQIATALVSMFVGPKANGNGKESFALQFSKKLAPHSGKRYNSVELAKIVEAKNVNGLGPKLVQIRKMLATESRSLDSYISKISDSNGATFWDIPKIP